MKLDNNEYQKFYKFYNDTRDKHVNYLLKKYEQCNDIKQILRTPLTKIFIKITYINLAIDIISTTIDIISKNKDMLGKNNKLVHKLTKSLRKMNISGNKLNNELYNIANIL